MKHFCPSCQQAVANPDGYQCPACGYYRPGHGWPMDELLGKAIGGGKYHLKTRLGAGSFASVYEAYDEAEGLSVAIKVLESTKAKNTELRQRFQAEAAALRKLQHPNVVSCRATGLIDEYQPFIVLDLVEGHSLQDEVFSMRASAPTPMVPTRVLKIGMQIASALAFAHQQNLLHRDLNPNNVMLVRERGSDLVKIIDFGIAKILGKNTVDRVTRHIAGTPDFMAPEQFMPGQKLDPRLDLWQLGAVLYFALTGLPPYPSHENLRDMLLHMRKLLTGSPEQLGPRPSEKDPALAKLAKLDDLVAALLAPHPQGRPESAVDVMNVLRRAMASARKSPKTRQTIEPVDAKVVIDLVQPPTLQAAQTAFCPHCQDPVEHPDKSDDCSSCGSARPEVGWPRDHLVGREVGAGRFRVVRRRRSGIVGDGYVVLDKRSGQQRELCLITRAPQSSPVAQLVTGELSRLCRIEHAGLARMFETGSLPDMGCPFLLYELVEGRRLHDIIWPRGYRLPRLLDPRDAMQWSMVLASVLQTMHDAGFHHNSIDPWHIRITDQGRIKLEEVGMAQIMDAIAATRTIENNERADFMAPEQLNWDEPVTERADIYQLGAVLFFMLTGWTPYPADECDPAIPQPMFKLLQLQTAKANSTGPHPSGRVPAVRAFRKLDRVVSEMLSTRAAVRPATGAIVISRLQDALHEVDG